jgi:predicted ester cyclase
VDPDANIALLLRWLAFADAGFHGDFAEFISRSYAGHLSGRIHMDLPELQRLERAFAEAFSEVTRTVEDVWGSGDQVVLRVTTNATHRGDFNGIPATGRRVRFSGIVIYRFENEKIAESWGELDFAGLWRQLTTDQAASGS